MGLSPSSAFLVPAATPNTTNSQTIGQVGPQLASVWRTRTVSEALDAVLFPTVPAVYVQPTLTLSTTAALTIEQGTNFTNSSNAFVPTWSQNDAGTAVSHRWVRNGVDEAAISGAPTSRTNISESNVTSNISYRIRVDYSQGPQKNDNKGQPSGTPIAAGSVTSAAPGLTITPILPYYYIKSPVAFTLAQFKSAIATAPVGNSNVDLGNGNTAVITKVVASAAGAISIPYNLSNQFFGVAYSGPAKTNYFVTTLDSGPITAVFNAVETDTSTAGPTWSGQTFRYHLSPGPITNSNANIQIS